MQKNKTVRERAKNNGVPLWKIATHLGVSEFTFYRWLREEFDDKKKAEVLSVIDSIIKEEREGEL